MKEKLTHKYLEIDEPLRNYFTKRYAEYLIFLFSGITFLLVMHMFAFLPVFLIIMLIFIGGLSYNCVKCLDGDILKISGAVDEIYIPRARKKKAFDRDYLMLRTTDQKFIKVYNIKSYKIAEKNGVTIYFPRTALSQENNDTYKLQQFLYLNIDQREV